MNTKFGLLQTFNMDGFRIDGTVIYNHMYAADTVILVESEEHMQSLINLVVTESYKMGLYLYSAKSSLCSSHSHQ